MTNLPIFLIESTSLTGSFEGLKALSLIVWRVMFENVDRYLAPKY